MGPKQGLHFPVCTNISLGEQEQVPTCSPQMARSRTAALFPVHLSSPLPGPTRVTKVVKGQPQRHQSGLTGGTKSTGGTQVRAGVLVSVVDGKSRHSVVRTRRSFRLKKGCLPSRRSIRTGSMVYSDLVYSDVQHTGSTQLARFIPQTKSRCLSARRQREV